jgi:hypothetical protein
MFSTMAGIETNLGPIIQQSFINAQVVNKTKGGSGTKLLRQRSSDATPNGSGSQIRTMICKSLTIRCIRMPTRPSLNFAPAITAGKVAMPDVTHRNNGMLS